MIGKVSKPNQDLVAITKECMRRGVEACKPWAFIGDIGAAIAPFARKHGYSVVTEFGGHGVGVDFHEEPFVCHDSKKNTGMLMVPGMVFTVEPMINAGRRDVFIDASNDWTVYTQDGSMSAQWENTVLVTFIRRTAACRPSGKTRCLLPIPAWKCWPGKTLQSKFIL